MDTVNMEVPVAGISSLQDVEVRLKAISRKQGNDNADWILFLISFPMVCLVCFSQLFIIFVVLISGAVIFTCKLTPVLGD